MGYLVKDQLKSLELELRVRIDKIFERETVDLLVLEHLFFQALFHESDVRDLVDSLLGDVARKVGEVVVDILEVDLVGVAVNQEDVLEGLQVLHFSHAILRL